MGLIFILPGATVFSNLIHYLLEPEWRSYLSTFCYLTSYPLPGLIGIYVSKELDRAITKTDYIKWFSWIAIPLIYNLTMVLQAIGYDLKELNYFIYLFTNYFLFIPFSYIFWDIFYRVLKEEEQKTSEADLGRKSLLNWCKGYIRFSFFSVLILAISYAITSDIITEAIVLPIASNIMYLYVLITFIGYLKLQPEQVAPTIPKEPTISKEEQKQIIQSIDAFLRQSKAYLDPDYSREDVSKALNIPNRKIVEAFSGSEFESFNDYLSRKRIEYFLQEVEKNALENQSIEGLALASGFGSRATFYRAFKKFLGLTPKQYFESKSKKMEIENCSEGGAILKK